jgi:hypothetical protein
MTAFIEKHPEILAPLLVALSLSPLLIALAFQRFTKLRRRRAASEQVSTEDHWLVLRGKELSHSSSLEELATWAADGHILANDDLYNPKTRRWARASSYPIIAESINGRFKVASRQSDPAETGCTIIGIVAVVVVIVVLSVISDQKRRARNPSPAEISAEVRLETEVRQYLPADAQTRIAREGWAGSVSIYTRKSDFQEIAFPDRADVLHSVATPWCKTEGSGWFTTLRVRDIHTGEELASTRCK